jgi:hypothetical protein
LEVRKDFQGFLLFQHCGPEQEIEELMAKRKKGMGKKTRLPIR